jgi:hypothetical protein
MISIGFFLQFFFKPFLRNKIDPMPLNRFVLYLNNKSDYINCLFLIPLQCTIRLKLNKKYCKTQVGTRLRIKLFDACLWMRLVVTSVSSLARVGSMVTSKFSNTKVRNTLPGVCFVPVFELSFFVDVDPPPLSPPDVPVPELLLPLPSSQRLSEQE